MEKPEVARLVGELKGAPASLMLAMLLLGRPMSLPELSTVTRYSAPTLRGALDRLALLGFVQEESRVGQFVLTVQAKQFILGQSDPQVTSNDRPALEEKNFFRLHEHVCEASCISPSEKPDILDVEAKNFFDADAEAAVQLLVEAGRYERTRTGKGARDSVETAIAAGWSGTECLACVEGWLGYWQSDEGKWIKDVGYIAYALRERHKPPSRIKLSPTDPQAYISGEFGHLLKH